MKLLISRLSELHYGFDVSLDNSSNTQRIALINGNKPEYSGPVILLNLDPHAVYGLSHPAVIGNIVGHGQPQELWTTKDIAHRLYEHGMKSCWGTIKQKNIHYQTRPDSFYTPLQSGPLFTVESNGNGYDSFVSVKLQLPGAFKTIVLTSRQQIANPNQNDIVVPVENIKTFTSFEV